MILGDLSDAYPDLPSLEYLRRMALESLGIDPSNSIRLRDAIKALSSTDPSTAQKLIRKHLSNGLSDYRALVALIQAPWDRVYSIGGLALDPIRFEQLPQPVLRVSGCDPNPDEMTRTLLVDNALIQDLDPVSFLLPASGTQREIWGQELRTRTLRRPTIAIANTGHELLWQILESRDADSKSRCFVVLRHIRPEDQLAAINVAATLVQGSLDDLAKALPAGHMKLQAGRRALARKRKGAAVGVGVQLVATLVREHETAEDWSFLRGFDPTWDDVSSGRLLELPVLGHLRREVILDKGARNTVVLRGRAGAGKTAALMQLGYELTTHESIVVAWIDRAATQSMARLLDEVLEIEPDCVIVDDVDIFGDSAPDLLRRLNRHGDTLVVASVRTTREHTVGWAPGARYVDELPMSDADIDSLERLLDSAGLLGSLQGVQPRQTRLEKIRKVCERDLLAALIQIVTGQRFEERIRSEFSQLTETEQRAYLTLAVYVAQVNESKRISEEDLLQSALAGAPLGAMSRALDSLISKRLLMIDDSGVGVRHRAIADALVAGMSRERIAMVVGALLRYYAGRAHAITDASHPERRKMVALLSHSLMVRLGLPRESVRTIYASVKPLLDGDFHYWLQRGAYETEQGDQELARSYLESARSCPGGLNDYKVTTEWGILRLQRAQRSPGSLALALEARDALHELLRVAATHGASSPHTYKVLASEGDAFVGSTQLLPQQELMALRDELDRTVGVGLMVCRDNFLAMEALESYSKRRGNVVRPAAPRSTLYPMPKPKPPSRRLR